MNWRQPLPSCCDSRSTASSRHRDGSWVCHCPHGSAHHKARKEVLRRPRLRVRRALRVQLVVVVVVLLLLLLLPLHYCLTTAPLHRPQPP